MKMIMKSNVISYLLVLFLLIQSCVVYQKTPLPIDQAVDKGWVKVEIEEQPTLYYKNIVIKNGDYYGNFNGYITRVDTLIMESINMKDVKRSKRANIVLFGIVMPVSVALGLLYHASRTFGG